MKETVNRGKWKGMKNRPNSTAELKILYEEMNEYYSHRMRLLSRKRFSSADKQRLDELFTTIQRKSGWAAPLIADITGLSKVHLGSEEVDM